PTLFRSNSYIDQMPASFFTRLIDPKAFTPDFSDPNRDPESVTQIASKFFGQLGCTGRHNVHILRRPWFAYIRIDGLCAEQDSVLPSLQKFKHGFLDPE